MLDHQLVLLVSSTSGGGKTTLVNQALQTLPNFQRAITCTTRKPREGEVDKRDYYFLDKEDFLEKTEQGYFLEWANVYGNFYGTSKNEISRLAAEGKHCILVVDVQGYRIIRQQGIKNLVTLFIRPPSKDEVLKRLRDRKTESEATLRQRESMMDEEIKESASFDHCIVNSNFDVAVAEFIALAKSLESKL